MPSTSNQAARTGLIQRVPRSKQPVLGQLPDRDDPVLYMGDFSATVHAIDAIDGSLVWRAAVGDHPDATITGSPKLHDGALYVPLSSSEWATAADPGYACCTFRGGVVSVDAASGELELADPCH